MERIARELGRAVLAMTLLAVGAARVEAQEASDAATAPISLSDVISFAEGSSGEIGLMAPKGGALRAIEDRCGLQRALPAAIAREARKRGVELVLTSAAQQPAGRVLAVRIAGAVGQLGGPMSGTKSLTLRGELRDGDLLIGSFVAREQHTSLTAGTCRSLTECAEKLAEHIAKWLERPTPRARLGSA